MKLILIKNIYLVVIFTFFPILDVMAEEYDVFYAGFSFSGNYIDKQTSAKFTDKLLNKKNSQGLDVVSASLLESLQKIKTPNYNIRYGLADLDKGSKESIVMSVALDSESYSIEYFPITKTYANFIDMYFQIMFYNFKSQKLIASIPFDVEISSLSKRPFTQTQILEMIEKFYTEGLLSDSNIRVNAFHSVEKILSGFTLKDKYRFRIGVTEVNLGEKSFNSIPKKMLTNLSSLKNNFAQSLSQRLSLAESISLVPYQEGVTLGSKMKQRFANTDEIYEIELPKPDFNIELTVRGFKKVLAKTSDVSNIFLYGSYANIKILQPDLDKVYIDARFKNANQIKIPVGIEEVDDWRKFNYSLIKLFDDFSSNITKTSNGYLKNQTKDTGKLKTQLKNVADVLDKVR